MWLKRWRRSAPGSSRAAPTFRPAVERLEERAVPAFLGPGKPKLGPPSTGNAGGSGSSGSTTALVGTISGTWTAAPPKGTSSVQVVNGKGTVNPLGAVKLSGTLTTTTFTHTGTTTGSVVLSSTSPGALSTLTLALKGAAPVPGGSPSTVTYTIMLGKGSFSGDMGTGTAHLSETFFKGSIMPTFTLTFG